jgi:mRNA interferase RelE/StbE
VTYEILLSRRAVKDLDRLDSPTRQRIIHRLGQIADAPQAPRLSGPLTNEGGLRKSRVGGWRIIFTVDDDSHTLFIVTIERRGQVYQRL